MLDVITSTAALLALPTNGVTWLTLRMLAHQILQLRFPILRYSISTLFSISTPRPKTLSRQKKALSWATSSFYTKICFCSVNFNTMPHRRVATPQHYTRHLLHEYRTAFEWITQPTLCTLALLISPFFTEVLQFLQENPGCNMSQLLIFS
jgi:hypothetical protein